jgi:hypothetical protein
MIKKILFPIFAIFLAYQSYKILKTISIIDPYDSSFSIQLLLSLLLNLFITGIFAFIGFAFKSSKLLTNGYYKIYNQKLLHKLYKIMKVNAFKKLLLLLFWGKPKNRKQFFDGTKAGLEDFDFQTRQAEFGHLGAFVFILFTALLLLIEKHYLIATMTLGLNILANFYPIILQRTHRSKIERIKSIQKRI